MNSSTHSNSSIILKELNVSPSDIDTEDVIFYAKLIGIDPISEPELLWIARAGLLSLLPSGWIAVEDRKGRLYYYDQRRKKSSWEHPSDSYYRSLVKRYRASSLSSVSDIPLATNSGGTSQSSFNSAMSGLNFNSNLQHLHFFDDVDDDDDEEEKDDDDDDELAEADQEKNRKKKKKEKEKEKRSVEKAIEKPSGNDWVTTDLPSGNHQTAAESQGKWESVKKEGKKDEEEEFIESVEYEIENELQEVSDDEESIMVEIIENNESNEEEEDDESIVSLKELLMIKANNEEGITTTTTVMSRMTTKEEQFKDTLNQTRDTQWKDSILNHNNLKDNLDRNVFYNNNVDDSIESNRRSGNRPQSANIIKKKQLLQQQQEKFLQNHQKQTIRNGKNNIITLTVVQEDLNENYDETKEFDVSKATTETAANIGDRRMSQRGLISLNSSNDEEHQKKEGEKEKEEKNGEKVKGTLIVEQINEQHQSLNGIRIEDPVEQKQNVEKNLIEEVEDSYGKEEFDSESNSKIVSLNDENLYDDDGDDDDFKKRFNDNIQQMQWQITNLRKELVSKLDESNELLQKQINSQILSWNNQVDIIRCGHKNAIEMLSKKIDELNLSLEQRQSDNKTNQFPIRDKMDELIIDNVNRMMNDINQNIEPKLMRISANLDKTIINQMDKVSQQIETKVNLKQEQMMRRELSLSMSGLLESIKQILSETNRLCDKLKEEFHLVVKEVQLLCDKHNESLESLRIAIEEERKVSEENFNRIDTNIAQLDRNVKSTVSTLSLPPQHKIRDMIDAGKESLYQRSELDDEKIKLMQQIDSKSSFESMQSNLKLKERNNEEEETSTVIKMMMSPYNKQSNNSGEDSKPNYCNDSHPEMNVFQMEDMNSMKHITNTNVDSNSKIMKVFTICNDHHHQNNNNNNNNDEDNDVGAAGDISINCNEQMATNSGSRNRKHLQLLEQCNILKKLLESFQINDDNKTEDYHVKCYNINRNEPKIHWKNQTRKRCEIRRCVQQTQTKTKNSKTVTKTRRRNQLSNLDNNESNYDDSSQSLDSWSSSIIYYNHSPRTSKWRQQWSRSTPNLNCRHQRQQQQQDDCCCCRHKLIIHNDWMDRNRSYMNLSLGKQPETISSMANEQVRKAQKASNSLISMIKQTTNQLKQELNNIDMFGNYYYYRPSYCDTANGDGDDRLKLLFGAAGQSSSSGRNNLIFSDLKKSNHEKVLSSFSEINDNRNHQDQLLMFRLRSIRDSVNDRLMKISSAIEQQKITQI